MNPVNNNQHLPHKLMVLISLVQGFCLLYLHQAIDLEYWPHQQPQWLFALYSVAFIWPIMLLLSLKSECTRALLALTLPFVLLCGLLGYYVGYQVTPVEHLRYDGLLWGYVCTMTIATFKALMYSQQLAAGERISYSTLFRWSWRNFLILGLSLLFAGILWLILMLWGELFKAIRIDFFQDLFEQPWFYYPTIALATGLGIITFRRLSNVIDTITRLQQALMKFLLVVLVLVSLLFLGTLPFTGLDPLWNSGGSALILWMQALTLFFISAVYQDEPDQRPYGLWLHRFITLGVVVLPVYSVIVYYGLSLRVSQYGWTIDRCWACLIWFLLALFPIGYLWGIFKKKDNWLYQLSGTNVAVGFVALATMLLVNSPLLDFRKIVAHDQLQRLAIGEVEPGDFDINYFRRSLARPGFEGLQQIKKEYGKAHPNLLVRINELYNDPADKNLASTKQELAAAINVLAGDPPPLLFDAIHARQTENHWQVRRTREYYLTPLDLNDDSQTEYLLVSVYSDNRVSTTLFHIESGRWLNTPVLMNSIGRREELGLFLNALRAGEIKISPPEWSNLEIGNQQFQVRLKQQ